MEGLGLLKWVVCQEYKITREQLDYAIEEIRFGADCIGYEEFYAEEWKYCDLYTLRQCAYMWCEVFAVQIEEEFEYA